MTHTATITVETDNIDLTEGLTKTRSLSRITNRLWRDYRQNLNPDSNNNKFRDIRTEQDIDDYLKELQQLFPAKITDYVVKVTKEKFLKELSEGAFVINIDTGEHTKIKKHEINEVQS